ncbi:MAG: PBP1A family penicillin-binding protein [Nitrospirota bacterium]|nr:PBP1A family penicillin-binding protein [Nitrospirota bacterium]MDH5767759.1 PBP1A family penicillin-binding protein [Nitrospirota bacterium]
MRRPELEVEKAKKMSFSKKIFIAFIISSALVGILCGSVYWIIFDLPKIKTLEEYTPIESSRVYSSEGKVIAELYIERRTFIPHYQIPDHLKKAFISVEDIRFYAHPGVDLIGIARALWHDIKAGGIVEGGSTITQQLARMLFLTSERSIKRKLKEAVLSIKIERHYTKDEILGLYLNQAYFGTRAYGIEAASQTYFGKSVNELTLGEAALLASLPKAPSLFSPFKRPDKAMERRSVVLKKMLNYNFITRAEFDKAMNEPLPKTPHMRKYEAPYFIESLRQRLEQQYGNKIYTAGYKIYSTIDHRMQNIAEEAVKKGIEAVEKRVKLGVQASLIALDLRTGHIKAMVGGLNFWKNQFNRATQALRQPGSAFKPFVYLTAFENGMASEDTIIDSPISFKGSRQGKVWSPKNYDGKYYGVVTLKTALAKSLNSATIRVADRVGIKNVIETAQRLGIKCTLQPYLPTALGASDVTLMDMVSAYSTFATGSTIEPITYERIMNRDGAVLEETRPEINEVIDKESIGEMKQALNAVIKEGTAQRAKELGRPVYGKTGTTNNYTDAWFIGFDDRLVVGVWVGRDDHTPIGQRETGSRAALPIWIEFMKKALLQTPAD